MPNSDELRRLRVFFSGTVQGIGFRYTTQRTAGNFAVTGWVRNRSDGRVEALIEGAEDQIENLLSAIHAEMGGYITKIERVKETHTGEFASFTIAPTV